MAGRLPRWDDRGVGDFDDIAADAYARFMGRFSGPLAPLFADLGLEGVDPRGPVLDVGCGPGVLTAELVRRRGAERVSAIDPSEPFCAATRAALPGVDVRRGVAEDLPYDDDAFGAALAQLVVHFMSDPVRGLGEMARVTAPGGRVSACVWDHAGGTGPLSGFWSVVRRRDPGAADESGLAGAAAGALTELFDRAGLRDVREDRLTVRVAFRSFDDWWEPFTRGVGPAGTYVAGLTPIARAGLVGFLKEEYGEGPFEIEASAWAAAGLV